MPGPPLGSGQLELRKMWKCPAFAKLMPTPCESCSSSGSDLYFVLGWGKQLHKLPSRVSLSQPVTLAQAPFPCACGGASPYLPREETGPQSPLHHTEGLWTLQHLWLKSGQEPYLVVSCSLNRVLWSEGLNCLHSQLEGKERLNFDSLTLSSETLLYFITLWIIFSHHFVLTCGKNLEGAIAFL